MSTAILIEDIITNANTYAADILDQAVAMVEDAANTAQGRVYLSTQPWSFRPDDPDTSFVVDELPSAFTDTYVAPDGSQIETAQFLDPYIPVTPQIPEAPAELDVSGLFDIPRPEWSIPDLIATEPTVDTDIALPALPSIVYPDAPEGESDALLVPDITVPTFDDTFAGEAPDVTDIGATYQAIYAQALPEMRDAVVAQADAWILQYCPDYFTALATLESKIAAGMEGGTGMTGAWEQNLFERGRLRVLDQHDANTRAVSEAHAKRGFAAPPGALMGGLARAQFETSRNLSVLAAEVLNERQRIELQHLQFCAQLSTTIRQSIINNALAYMQTLATANGQAIQYAGESARWAAEMFNQRVQLFTLELERYRTEGQLFSVRMEAAFAELKKFEAEVEAERLKLDVDNAAVALYRAKMEGEQTKIQMYVAQFEGVRAQVQVQAQQVAVFESQVRAYAARIGAKEGEYNAYRAALSGDTAQVEAYATQVQAYSQRVNAIGTTVDAERAISQSITEYNRALIERQDAGIKKYLAELNAEGQRFSSSVEANKAALARYSTEINARLTAITSQYERDRLVLQGKQTEYDGRIKTMVAGAELSQKGIAAQADIVNAGARVLGNLASAALTVNNAIVTQSGEG